MLASLRSSLASRLAVLGLLAALLVVAAPAAAAIVITDQPGPSFGTTTDAVSFAGASWTPTNGTVAIAWVLHTRASIATAPSLGASNGLTWTEITHRDWVTIGSPSKRLTVFRANVTGSSAGAITVDFAGQTQTGCALALQTLAGVPTTGVNASDAIIQSVTSYDDNGGTRSPCASPCTTAQLLKLAPLTNRSNAVMLGVGLDNQGANFVPAAPAGWTLGTIQSFTPSPPSTLNAIWSTAPETLYPAVTWTNNTKNAAIALEIAHAAPPASATNMASVATGARGPFVGGVTSTTATLWARTNGAAGEITFKWSLISDLSSGVTSQVASAGPSTDFTTTTSATGLTPGTKYYYRADGDGGNSTIRSFTTFPTVATTAKIVFLTDFQTVSSNPPNATPTTTFTNADAEGPNFVLLGGDFDHSDPGVGGNESTSRTNQRAMWNALYDPTVGPAGRANADMSTFGANILNKYPIAHGHDDHDYDANNTNYQYNWRDTVTKAEYGNYMPNYGLPAVAGGIWQKFSYGGLVDVFILDSRSQRTPNSTADDGLLNGDGVPHKSMLDGLDVGATGQFIWLKQQLTASTATWKLVLAQVNWNHSSIKLGSGNPDNWYGYQTEQTQIKNYVRDLGIHNVVLLTGDSHFAALSNGSSDPLNFVEITGPSPNFVAGGAEVCNNLDTVGTWSHGTWGTPGGICNGYVVLTFTAATLTATVKDLTGAIPTGSKGPMTMTIAVGGGGQNFHYYYGYE